MIQAVMTMVRIIIFAYSFQTCIQVTALRPALAPTVMHGKFLKDTPALKTRRTGVTALAVPALEKQVRVKASIESLSMAIHHQLNMLPIYVCLCIAAQQLLPIQTNYNAIFDFVFPSCFVFCVRAPRAMPNELHSCLTWEFSM